ncbi:MAG: methionyl-tRNA formyltransferase [Candidatus Moranbacteria bacterium]|nr:methionyl-tRNA formyltransferase [Candidatus Moranbacteria bacterium]
MQNKKLKNQRIVFMGTSDFAAQILNKLIKNDLSPIAVCAKSVQNFTPVKELINKSSKKKSIPLWEIENFSDKKYVKKLESLNIDLIIVAAFGVILPKSVLKLPVWGCINIHPSLLPKYRGPSPIQTAILNNDKTSGTTIMLLNDKMDAGDILTQKKIKIDKKYFYKQLEKILAQISCDLLLKTLKDYLNGKILPKKQNHQKATYTKLIKKADGHIDWRKKASEIEAKFRAYTPWPGIFTFFQSSKGGIRIQILDLNIIKKNFPQKPGTVIWRKKTAERPIVITKKGAIELVKIKPQAKKEMDILEFINGHHSLVGSVLK